MKKLGSSDLEVFPLALGGNTFGWTSDEQESFAVLDAYVAAGGNFIDTADSYSRWVPGHNGGESEIILGKWLKARKNRGSLVISTKVGQMPARPGLAPANIRAAVDDSLQRMRIDVIDLYFAHIDDQKVPLEDVLGTFDDLIKQGKLRHIAASQYTAPRLAQAAAISKKHGYAKYVALQTHYSLVHRHDYEGALADVCAREGIATMPFWGLARGFLTGKYRPGQKVESARSGTASEYLNAQGLRVLGALDAVAAAHRTTDSAVALAWLTTQKAVGVPLASARTEAQLDDILPFVELTLSSEEIQRLTEASS